MHALHGSSGALVVIEIYKTEAKRGTVVLLFHHDSAGDQTKLAEGLMKLSVGDGKIDILDEYVRPGFLELLGSNPTRNKRTNVDLLVEQEIVVDHLYGVVGTLLVFEVDEAVTLGPSLIVQGNLTRENVTKGREGIVEFFVANLRSQVLDEDVANASLSDTRITLRPHNSTGFTTKRVIVEGIQCPFSIDYTVKVYIGVTQRPTRKGIPTNTDRSKRTHRVKDIAEHALVDFRCKIAYIERG